MSCVSHASATTATANHVGDQVKFKGQKQQ